MTGLFYIGFCLLPFLFLYIPRKGIETQEAKSEQIEQTSRAREAENARLAIKYKEERIAKEKEQAKENGYSQITFKQDDGVFRYKIELPKLNHTNLLINDF